MGGSTASTPQGSGLPNMFGQNTGYQQPNQVAPIAQPTLQTPILPTPEQAAQATQARMAARNPPMAAPAAAPRKQARTMTDNYGGGHGRF